MPVDFDQIRDQEDREFVIRGEMFKIQAKVDIVHVLEPHGEKLGRQALPARFRDALRVQGSGAEEEEQTEQAGTHDPLNGLLHDFLALLGSVACKGLSLFSQINRLIDDEDDVRRIRLLPYVEGIDPRSSRAQLLEHGRRSPLFRVWEGRL